MSADLYTKAVTTTSRLRLLVLSEVDDWDFGRQVKASGHEIVAWARPFWKRNPKGYGLGYTIRTFVRAMLCRSKPIRAMTPRFDTWRWLDKEKIQRITSPNVNSPKFVEYVKSLNIDLIVVFFFPQILKPACSTPPA